jgi:diguanylate cyclase (GGDEF)-like protein
METPAIESKLLEFIVDRINVGVLAIDTEMKVVLWNRFLEVNSGRSAREVIGISVFDSFPELPREWLRRKIDSVRVLKNFSFTSWQQRPYLFRFRHHRPITGGADYMRQDCAFMPMCNPEGDVEHVCIVVSDATDTSVFQGKLNDALVVIAAQNDHDAMTGLFNRRKLDEDLGAELQRSRRYGRPLSILMMDIDHFKKVNDTYGHHAGDDVIRHVATVAKGCLRTSDFMGRYGGEEFVVVLPEVGAQGAQVVAERIRARIAEHAVVVGDRAIPVTSSLGVTERRTDTADMQALIQEADKALYVSKARGRNCVSLFAPAPAPG